MTSSTTQRRCQSCGGRVGERDRACFTCQALLPVPAAHAETPIADDHAPDVAPAAPPPPPVVTATIELDPLPVELRYGRTRVTTTVTSGPAFIGSADGAELCVRAGFLHPRHARIDPGPDGWVLAPVAPGAVVLDGGTPTSAAQLRPGATYRVGDGVGNWVQLRVLLARRDRGQRAALRAPLPEVGMSFLIGSDPSCAVRLDHPLVHPRHATMRRDHHGTLWLEDRRTAAGTYVDGIRLSGRTRISPGSVVQIGPYSARVGDTALEPMQQVEGVDIAVDDASVVAVGKSGAGKTLLDRVQLRIRPASMTAVVGPSGAGKTTLMRLLSGQLAASSGQVTYNDTDLEQCRAGFAELMGFVPQDDVVHTELTVREALGFQAELRLGQSTLPEERAARIAQTVQMLGLGGREDQIVRTLSGGQRKRVSIACELLKEPQLLFLDEPTSGLDPGLDKRMLMLLRLLADQGRTVVVTTHSVAHIDICDTLILMGPGGRVLYAGDPEGVAEAFSVASLSDVFALLDTPDSAVRADTDDRPHADTAPRAAPVDSGPTQRVASGRAAVGSPAWRALARAHARVFAARQIRLIRRDRTALAYSLLQGVGVALLTALVAPSDFTWSVSSSPINFVIGCAAVWFGMIGSVREIVKERAIWRREFMAGGNLAAYLSAKTAVLAAVGLIQALTMTIVLALTLGLPHGGPLAPALVTYTVTLWLANVCGIGIGLLVSAGAPSADRALSQVPYLLIAQLILCGVLFHLGAMTFVSWFMPARWAVSALGGIAGLDPVLLHQSSGLYPHSALGLLGSWVALLVLTSAALAGTAWSLVRQGRCWQTGVDSAPSLWSVAKARLGTGAGAHG